MAGHYIRKRVWAADWSFFLVAFSGALLLTGFAFFRASMSDRLVFAYTVIAVAGFLALGLLLSFYSIAQVWRRGGYGGGRAIAALFLGLIVAAPFVGGGILAYEYPTGNSARTAGLVNETEAEIQEGGALMLGRDFPATAREVYQASRQVLDDLRWRVVEVESASLPELENGDLGVSGTVSVPLPTLRSSIPADTEYDRFAQIDAEEYDITAEAFAPLFHFASDVAIRIQEDSGTTFVDVQATSRDVPRDLGQNRRFIDAFLMRLEAVMSQRQSGVVED
ncbi:DUF1499 domain-containing protein [Aureimonas fodinaquatilis]|uniref:DUF1499 domain-containing protein n=1 Tax=Aureimonas fodinaquatilis TaxID=2565783 RepID=A0A5B0E2Z2_9HYPH|nr:DUF1499 domain-containing protein [Aureimonas fodinaquatilis]KAA0972505.1 DUF1499 domain-containing protein [Aureimonas fodinaquatilis]